jgi:hypothetical protein
MTPNRPQFEPSAGGGHQRPPTPHAPPQEVVSLFYLSCPAAAPGLASRPAGSFRQPESFGSQVVRAPLFVYVGPDKPRPRCNPCRHSVYRRGQSVRAVQTHKSPATGPCGSPFSAALHLEMEKPHIRTGHSKDRLKCSLHDGAPEQLPTMNEEKCNGTTTQMDRFPNIGFSVVLLRCCPAIGGARYVPVQPLPWSGAGAGC